SVPVAKLASGAELGLEPDGGAVEWRRFRERRLGALQRLEPLLQVRERRVVEAATDVTRVLELALVPVAEQQRAERLARALPLRVAPRAQLARLLPPDLLPPPPAGAPPAPPLPP